MDSTVASISRAILAEGESSWKLWLCELIDAFRRDPRRELIEAPPAPELAERLQCLIASTVEALCDAAGVPAPEWCRSVAPLPSPWFVSGIENLKATALVESPAHFRKRNLFVLGNFLERA